MNHMGAAGKAKKRGNQGARRPPKSQTPHRAPAPRGVFAGARLKAKDLELSHCARELLRILEEKSIRGPRLPVIMIGYGCRSPRPGLAEESKFSRRQCIRGVEELEQVGVIKVGGDRSKEGHRGRIKMACGWRYKWQQRPGGRTPEGPGRANEYAPGQTLGLPVRKPSPIPPALDEEDPIASAEARAEYFQQLADGSRERAAALKGARAP